MNTKTMNTEKNYYETFVDSQKKLIDTMTEATSKFTNNEFVNETIEKSSSLYKNWMDTQLDTIKETTEKIKTNPTNVEELKDSAKNWMENQMNVTKDFINFSMNTMKNYMESLNKNLPAMNGSGEQMKNMFDTNMKTFNQMSETMQKQFDGWMTNFKTGDFKNIALGMFNQTDAYNKFVEMWTPVVKSMQNNTYKPEMFSQMMNPSTFQEFINKTSNYGTEMMSNFTKFFNPNAGNSNEMWSNMMKMFNPSANPFSNQMPNFMNMFNMQNNPANDMMKQMMSMYNGSNNPFAPYTNQMNQLFTQQFSNLQNMNPNLNNFGNMMDMYNSAYSNMQNVFGPMNKMITPNANTENVEAINALMHKANQLMIKQTEMQYVTYNTAQKAMQKVAERMNEKMTKGEEFKGMTALYNEWLTISDKIFVELFESDEFSKLQAEYASLSHSYKKDCDLMMEKMFANFPLINRTEMDDTYKTIYDLKKRVNELERQVAKSNVAPKATPVVVVAPKVTPTVKPIAKPTAKRK